MSTNRTPLGSRRSLQGFTLIEVMVALLIFSFGLLGTAALQARAVQIATQNGDRSRAALLANEMVTKLWANQSTDVTVAPLSVDYGNWQTSVSNAAVSGLPSGTGTVAPCAGTANCAVVTITWRAPSATAAAQKSTYWTTVVIQ